MAASRDEKIATPERSVYNVRGASGCFCKVGKIEKKKQETKRKLHEGFQKWSVKRKLEYEIERKQTSWFKSSRMLK